jgi:predicted nuclease of predicted toxin-antitoxin system
MRIKLDENFGTRTQKLFHLYNHDVQTVRMQDLQGCADTVLFEVCCAEKRCLVTFDLDFADTLRFPPEKTSEIAIVRPPQNPSLPLLEQYMQQFLNALAAMPISGKLWIIEAGRIRIHETDEQ